VARRPRPTNEEVSYDTNRFDSKVEDLGIEPGLPATASPFKGPKGALAGQVSGRCWWPTSCSPGALRDRERGRLRVRDSPACARCRVAGPARVRPPSRPEASSDTAYGPEKLGLLVEEIGADEALAFAWKREARPSRPRLHRAWMEGVADGQPSKKPPPITTSRTQRSIRMVCTRNHPAARASSSHTRIRANCGWGRYQRTEQELDTV